MHWDGASLDIRGNLIVGPGHGFVLEGASMVCAYDGPRPYATDFQVDLTGHLGQRATAIGAVIGRPGVFGKALQTGGAATNLIYNPVFGGTYSSGLAPSLTESDPGSVLTPSENTDMAYIEYGTQSQKIVLAAGGSYLAFDHAAMANSTTYTWYLRFYLAAGSIQVVSFKGTNYNAETFNTLGWNTYCYTGTTDGSGSSFIWYIGGSSFTVYLTRCQIVAAGYNTPLISGNLPSHTWAGTAYASTSSRVASYVTYPIGDVIKNARKGSVGFWYFCDGWNTNSGIPWQAGDANAELDCYIDTDGLLVFRVNGVTASQASSAVRTWHHAVLTWDCDTDFMYVYVDGVQGTHAHPTTVSPTLHATVFGVGYSAPIGTTYIHPGYLCDFFVTEAVLTADQVRQIYQSGLPVVATRNPMSLLLTGAGRGKVEGSAAGIFATDELGAPNWSLFNQDFDNFNGVAADDRKSGDVLLGDNSASKANLLWDKTAGKLLFRGGTTAQVEIGTDGKLSAGGGKVLLSAAGIALIPGAGYDAAAEYGFDFGGVREAGFYTYVASGAHYGHLDLYSLTDRNASFIMSTNCPAAKESQILIIAGKNGASVAYIDMGTTNSGEIDLRATRLGFYDTVPIAKQTGVPVSAAGVHAAMVALGFIEA
jgi:hypothetical protein